MGKIKNQCKGDASLAFSHTFVCAQCGRDKEIPIMCESEKYGWFSMGQRMCSYTCMRAYEQREIARRASVMSNHARTQYERKQETFACLMEYTRLRLNGMKAKEASDKAGFITLTAAQSAAKYYKDSEEYAQFVAVNG